MALVPAVYGVECATKRPATKIYADRQNIPVRNIYWRYNVNRYLTYQIPIDIMAACCKVAA